MKKILIFSYNPVPTDEYKKIEGSALRFWRMARALYAKGELDITIAVWEKFPQTIAVSRGIKLTNFSAEPGVIDGMVGSYDVVIFSSNMGQLSTDIYTTSKGRALVVSDAYSPLYVEGLTSSLDAQEDSKLLEFYKQDVAAFNEILIGADYLLVANENQKHLYRGVLGGLLALAKHDDSRFIMLPAYVEKDEQVTNRTALHEKLEILWFGGIYPWFDITEILAAFAKPEIQSKARLTVLGGSNPFYPKDSIRFNGKYINAVKSAEDLGLIENGTVVFENWVDYDKRIQVFNRFDAAISINSDSIENDYSFRIRIADLAGNGLPLISNGGDTIGDMLIEQKAAFKIAAAGRSMSGSLEQIFDNRKSIVDARRKLRGGLYEGLHIERYIDNLLAVIDPDLMNASVPDTVGGVTTTRIPGMLAAESGLKFGRRLLSKFKKGMK